MQIQSFKLFEGDSSMRGKVNYTLTFPYENQSINFESNSLKDISSNIFDWLYQNNYKFDGSIHNSITRKLLTKNELDDLVKKTSYGYRSFHNVGGSNHFLINSYNSNIMINFIISMLSNFGIEKESISHSGFYDLYDDYTEAEEEEVDLDDQSSSSLSKMTFIEAAQLILKKNQNEPMSARDIWDEIEKQNLVSSSGSTPWATLNAEMLRYSDNSKISKRKKKLFHIVAESPIMFILINPEQEVQPVEDELDLELPTKTSAFTLPPEDEVFPFSHFRGIQSQEEREKQAQKEREKPVDFEINPFMQSVCILGSSGRGKSTTIDNMLEKYAGMKYDFIIPTASTTGLLAQFSPSGKEGKGGYIPSRLGKMIMDAHNNPGTLYTAVFDECHKASVIEMINDELLQCISTKRNRGNRFISLDTETESLFTGLKDYRGNLLLPDNFGFIFLSSKPDVITSNADFFNRVNIYILKKLDYDTIDYSNMVTETGTPDENGKPTFELNPEYFIFVPGKSKEDIKQIEKLNDEE